MEPKLAGPHADAIAGDPVDLAAGPGAHRTQRHPSDTPRMRLRVHQRKPDAPRDAGDHPPVDRQMFAQPLDVRDQVIGGDSGQVGVRVTDQSSTATAATLIELHCR